MFPQRCEQQRPVVLHPKIALRPHKVAKPLLGIFDEVDRLEVFLVEPLLVSSPHGSMGDSAFAVYTQEQVNSRLLVSVCSCMSVRELGYSGKTRDEPRRELV